MVKKLTQKQTQAIQTKQKLINSARKMFLNNGFEKTTITQIAEDAKLGYGTAYVYFKNKNELFSAIIEDVMQHFFIVASTPFRPTSAEEAKEIIQLQVKKYMELAIEHRVILREVKKAIGISEDILSVWQQIRNRVIQGIKRDIQYAISQGLVDPTLDPEIVAYSWYSINETFMWEFVDSNRFCPEYVVHQLSKFYTQSLYIN